METLRGPFPTRTNVRIERIKSAALQERKIRNIPSSSVRPASPSMVGVEKERERIWATLGARHSPFALRIEWGAPQEEYGQPAGHPNGMHLPTQLTPPSSPASAQ